MSEYQLSNIRVSTAWYLIQNLTSELCWLSLGTMFAKATECAILLLPPRWPMQYFAPPPPHAIIPWVLVIEYGAASYQFESFEKTLPNLAHNLPYSNVVCLWVFRFPRRRRHTGCSSIAMCTSDINRFISGYGVRKEHRSCLSLFSFFLQVSSPNLCGRPSTT